MADMPLDHTPDTPPDAPPDAPKPSLRAVVGWVLYDLANTIFSLGIISLYLPLWVVNVMGEGQGDSTYGYAFSLSMVVIFLVSPVLGALTDQSPRRMPFLIGSTLICIACTMLLGQGGLFVTLAAFVVANIAFQAGLQFYDSLLPVVTTEHNRGKIGGIGIGVGYIGSVVAIIAGQFIIGDVTGLSQAEQTARYILFFQVAGGLFLLFALPCFLFVREQPRPDRQFALSSVGAAVRQVGETLRSTRRYPNLLRFLIGRVFYTDAINTVIVFMGVYVTNEAGLSEEQAPLVLFTSIIAAIVGGLAWSQVVDRFGPKRTLNIVLYIWMGVFLVAAVIGWGLLPGWLFWGVAALAGIALAGTWTADRPFMLRLTPPDRVGEFYGLYGMVGRFAAITGPLVWALIVDELNLGRPVAIVSLLIGVIIGYIILRPVSDAPHTWEPAPPQ